METLYQQCAAFYLADWYVEPSLHQLSRREQVVRVEPKVMEVLVCLARYNGKVVSKDVFMDEVWRDTVVSNDVLSRCISELRKVFGDRAAEPHYIETIRKAGYRLIAPVTQISEYHTDEPSISAASGGLVTGYEEAGPVISRGAAEPSLSRIYGQFRGELLRWFRHRRRALWTWGAAGLIVTALLAFVWQWIVAEPFDPSSPVPLTSFPGEEIDPALSPDGEQIAFVYKNSSDEDFDLYIKQVGGESPLQLTDTPGDERSPTWSSDGLYISFVRNTEAGYTIHVIPSLGGSERQLADFGEREVQGLAWSPADSTMAVSARRVPYGVFSLYLLSVDTNQLRELTIPPHYYYGDIAPAFSSDGQQIAFVRGIIEPVQDVYRVSVDGGQPVRLTSDNVQVTGLSWMSDDRHLIFASARDGNSGLRRIARSGGAPDWIAAAGDNASLNQPSMVRESDRLAYARYASDTNIWILERSRQPRRLIHTTRWESNADISPDGKRIAFISNQSGRYAVWICDRDGMNPIQLTSMDNVFLSTPRWSTDGSKIAFVTWKEGSADIYMVEAIGGTPRRVSRSPYDEIAPSWSQDGNWIYYASNQSEDWQIWKMPEAGDSISVQVTWDGGVAAFEAENGDLFWVRPHEPGIWHRKVDADSIVKVVDSLAPEDGGNWAVRGKGIYYLERKANQDYIYYYSLTSRQTTQIAVLDRVPEHPNLAVAPDGKWFLYSQLEEIESDILLIDDLP